MERVVVSLGLGVVLCAVVQVLACVLVCFVTWLCRTQALARHLLFNSFSDISDRPIHFCAFLYSLLEYNAFVTSATSALQSFAQTKLDAFYMIQYRGA
jgi:hypothetical protein